MLGETKSDGESADPRPPLDSEFLTRTSGQAGPIFCGKPILRSTVPSLCLAHFQKAEKHVARALRKAGLNVTSPRIFVIKLNGAVPSGLDIGLSLSRKFSVHTEGESW
ncbi:hypothetical protein LWI29_006394 [Acer saccharum]|uniref:Uncharacterized protein n=1 Tax=Acer saccharum TaxID=4024 RepID=A0AA39S6B4_ACESA|nr:hypothetical protein LWI29_006394 [Acer saccharum]